ncbi:trypsin-like peptidase domain-containing protein [Yinghuangia sp. YIM S10712]|uniref:trypsin-like peptidase domain-containing protein n=1 Tax=Yinghuangia sp. YIM S10712 TaxID=3436930 RepID=UPI003F52E8B1
MTKVDNPRKGRDHKNPPVPGRCVEVLAYPPDGKPSYGSGYRVTSSLVLTAAHTLAASARIEVRFGKATLPVDEVVEVDTEADLALVRLPDDIVAELVPLAPVRVGVLPEGSGQIEVRFIGFPRFARRPTGTGQFLGEQEQVDARIQLGSGLKSGWLSLAVTSSAPPESSPAPSSGDPWAGASGAAVFATSGGELIGAVSRRLQTKGTASLDTADLGRLPDTHPIAACLQAEGVRWVALAPRPQPRALPPILSHTAVLENLRDAREYLVDSRLGFVSPGAGRDDDPHELFAYLSAPESRHVLLVGGVGGGKTRTCFEVAALAQSRGWRVYHTAEYARREITNAHLEEKAFEDDTPVLLIVDNVDDYADLDLGAIPGGLDEEAQRRGMTLRLLATARPRQAKLLDPSVVKEVFLSVALRNDTVHTTAIRNAVVQAAAPRAVARYGLPKVTRHCGRRSALALLMALDLESRLDTDDSPMRLDGVRSPGPGSWLTHGLDRDALKPRDPPPDAILADREPDPELVAVTAVAAACPQSREHLLAVAERILTGSTTDVARTAQRLLDAQIARGWLLAEQARIWVVHDQLTDELLHRTLLANDDAPAAQAFLDTILDACAGAASTLTRAAVALRRLHQDRPGRDASRLGEACADWLRRNADRVAALLHGAPPQPGAELLAALLGAPPWTAVVLELWETLALPWLQARGRHHAAHRPLALCLRRLPYSLGAPMIGPTLRWLDRYGAEPEAGFLIHALMVVLKPADEHRGHVLDVSVRWLEDYAETFEAGRLIALLLRRAPTIEPAIAAHHAEAARRWLARHGGDIEAFAVLRAALDARNYRFSVPEAVQRGETWLARHASVPRAADILIPVLRACDSLGPGLRRCALTWLGLHGESGRAGLVISALLQRHRILDAKLRAVALNKAARLLDRQEIRGSTINLLELMVGRDDPEVATRVVTAALLWIEQNAEHPRARILLGRLLARPGLPDEVRRVGAERALAFVRSQPTGVDLDRLLTPLLDADDPALAAEARAGCLVFLERFGTRAGASHVLRAMLGTSGLATEQVTVLLDRAQDWLDAHDRETHAWRVLGTLLTRPSLPQQVRGRTVERSIAWLDLHPHAPEAAGVLIGLLKTPGLARATADDVYAVAGRWLPKNTRHRAHRAVVMARNEAKARESERAARKPKRPRMSGRKAKAAASRTDIPRTDPPVD